MTCTLACTLTCTLFDGDLCPLVHFGIKKGAPVPFLFSYSLIPKK
jgi:hypothetical protein